MAALTAAQSWLSWQLADSNFPSGAFAHSAGLESATQAGLLPDNVALRSWLLWSTQNALSTSIGYINVVHADPQSLLAMDRHADTTQLNAVARRASVAMGNGLLAAAAVAFAKQGCAADKRLLRAAQASCHVAPVYGAVTARLGLPLVDSQRLWLFQQLRDSLSAAVRLNRLGPLAAQAMLADLAEPCLELLNDHAHDDERSICSSGAVVDVIAGGHDRLYSRLFQS